MHGGAWDDRKGRPYAINRRGPDTPGGVSLRTIDNPISEYVVPTAMVCFGYPTEHQKNRAKPRRFEVADMVHENGYDTAKSAEMERMLCGQTGKSSEEIREWIDRFCQRKWNSEFSVEMSRSCAAIVDAWKKGE